MTVTTVPAFSPRRRKGLAFSNAELGMTLFIICELMFFVALISSFLVIKSKIGNWVPPASVTLPVKATALNTLFLVVSGILLFFAGQSFAKKDRKFSKFFLSALFLGTLFVFFQGLEWVRLVEYGMTMTSGIFGACFFLLIGSHGIHALIGLLALVRAWWKVSRGKQELEGFRAVQYFWFFVVSLWPLLYGLVYF